MPAGAAPSGGIELKHALFAVLAASTFLSPVSAAEFNLSSKIDAVTVYPSGAEITRTATATITAGDHKLILDNLPGGIDPQSIRVEGSAGETVEIGSVDSKLVHVTGEAENRPFRRQIENQIETLQDQSAALDREEQNIEYQRQLIQDLARQPFRTQKSSETDLRLDSVELGNLFDLVASRLQALDERAMKLRIERRDIDKQIDDLRKRLSELAPKQTTRSIVTVHLTSAAETTGTFNIMYRIANAGWRPFYDARLDMMNGPESPSLSLVRRAEIFQSTSEDWNDIALTLSTARPVGATSAPELHPQALYFQRPRQPVPVGGIMSLDSGGGNAKRAFLNDRLDRLEGRTEADVHEAPVQNSGADVVLAGFQALYSIPGRVSVDSSGTAKKVSISEDTIKAAMSAHAVPAIDPNAYLMVTFTIDGETPLLPGRVLLFRDNVFMGQGALPLMAPGEEHALGFGVDDRVKVKRTQVHRETSESGLINTDIVEERSWVIEVQNLHARTMPVRIYDRMPYSTHEDIKVDMLPASTPPTQRDVDNRQGILAWDYKLAGGEEQIVRFGFRVASPKDSPLQLSMK